MKKNILTGAVLMALSFTSYAQNTVSVNQAGSNQTIKATQKGNLQSATINQTQGSSYNEENLADVTQTGYGANTVVVSQNDGSQYNRSIISQKNGSGNLATTEQNASGTGYNTGRIEQVGNYNQGTIKQSNSTSSNETFITQGLSSNYNTAYVEQTNKSLYNYVSIVQQGGNQGAGNEARVEQNGNGTWSSYDNTATITQSNLGNKTLISQNAILGSDSFNNKAYSTQNGVNGSVTITQNTKAVISQNETRVNQTVTSMNSKATVEQAAPYGGAVAYVFQTGTGEALIRQLGSTDDYADIKQAGGLTGKNVATVFQNSTLSRAFIYQAGNNNKGTITQNITYQNSAFIEQSLNGNSSNNVAFISQDNQYSQYLSSSVKITQGTQTAAATNSQAFISQTSGEANEAYLLQTGNEEFATITQSGYNNYISGKPGSTNAAQQSGDHNMLTVSQTSQLRYSDGPFLPSNIVYAIQAGSGNQATIIQAAN